MSLASPFYNNWVDVKNLWCRATDTYTHNVNLSLDFFNSLQFDEQSLKKYRLLAVERVFETYGNNIALALSGGIDSQSMLQCFVEANADFKLYVCKFNNDLNIHDVEYARFVAKMYNVPLIEIEFDVINFLIKHNYDTGLKYESFSPHFNVHFKFFDILFDLGHTGVCAGGGVIDRIDDNYGSNFDRSPFSFIKYSEISQRNCLGSFLSYSPELVWAISLLSKPLEISLHNVFSSMALREKLTMIKYENKIQGYLRAGLNVMRQKQKYTGFEKVKNYFAELTGNGWEFEQRFRTPLEDIFLINKVKIWKFIFNDDLKKHVLSIHDKNFTPNF